jgi:hypothetical protein
LDSTARVLEAIRFDLAMGFHSHGVPSGKHTKNYGKSPFLMGKLTISMAIFQFANC